MAYKDRTIELRFDGSTDLPELGDDIVVTIRNPKLLSPAKVTPRDVPLNADGTPQNPADMMGALYAMIAGIIVSWRVYDAEDDSDDPQPLGMPSEETVAKMPMAILNAISGEIEAISPN